jgi:hypothetical protein
VSRLLRDPHVALAAGVGGALAAEYLFRTRGGLYGPHPQPTWLIVEGLVALAALGVAWRLQDRLRLPPLLGLALVFQLAVIALHLHLHVRADADTLHVYAPQGDALLHGHYPRSEYPPGAVVLFALEKLLDPAHVATANRFLMVPFQLATVAAIWSLRTRGSAWLAGAVALWPLNTYFWELRYDLVPTAFLAVGLALAFHERWGWAGIALAVGTAAKWTPALAFAALAVWCLGRRELRAARRLSLAFAAGLLAFYLPFAWAASELEAAYRMQGARAITPESVWYLPLHALGQTHFLGIPLPAGGPRWADVLAGVIQLVLIAAALAAALAVRDRRAAVGFAALVPVLFLVTNRIFSAQYLVTMLGAWAIALALLEPERRRQGWGMLVALTASAANVFVFPFLLWNRDRTWLTCSAILFALSIALTGWLAAAALQHRDRATAWPST